jgi:Flp pilus assembly protein TadG
MRTKVLNRLGQWVQGAARDRRGSVATIFAVSLVPVLIAAGVGIDIARASAQRAALQDAIDATTLAVAHMPASSTADELKAATIKWANANLGSGTLTASDVDVSLINGKAVITARQSVPTTLTAVAGVKTMPISVTSTVEWGLGHIEVALVLDNTGSMAGTKLSRLKTAAASLVDSLANTTDKSDANALKISVVPFSTTVKIGTSYGGSQYKNASWMKGVAPAEYYQSNSSYDIFNGARPDRFQLFSDLGDSWGGCVESRPPPYDVSDTGPLASKPESYFVPYFAPDEPDNNKVIKSSFYGYTTYYDFDNNYIDDYNNSSPSYDFKSRQGGTAKYKRDTTRSSGPNEGCDMQSIVRLTTNMTTVKNKIAAMNAVGNTNIPIGLMWGWHTISPNAPFADGASYSDKDTKKFVVLLTDGDNTNTVSSNPNKSAYTAYGYLWQKRMMGKDGKTLLDEDSTADQRSDAMDARMEVACQAMKDQKITIYTVRIDVSGSASTALKNCASSADKFFDIDSSGLSDAFANIAGSIGRLRITN